MAEALIDEYRVSDIFKNCFLNDDEFSEDGKPLVEPVIVEGITAKFGFHPDRLQSYKDEVTAMLNNLPEGFQQTKGGGMSFLAACNDKNDIQWTGMHQIMEELFVLSMGLGLASYCTPRDIWRVMPGGMPYLAVHTEDQKCEQQS